MRLLHRRAWTPGLFLHKQENRDASACSVASAVSLTPEALWDQSRTAFSLPGVCLDQIILGFHGSGQNRTNACYSGPVLKGRPELRLVRTGLDEGSVLNVPARVSSGGPGRPAADPVPTDPASLQPISYRLTGGPVLSFYKLQPQELVERLERWENED